MQEYDSLVEILQVAEKSCESRGQIGEAAARRNLQTIFKLDPNLSKEIQKRMAALLAHGHLFIPPTISNRAGLLTGAIVSAGQRASVSPD